MQRQTNVLASYLKGPVAALAWLGLQPLHSGLGCHAVPTVCSGLVELTVLTVQCPVTCLPVVVLSSYLTVYSHHLAMYALMELLFGLLARLCGYPVFLRVLFHPFPPLLDALIKGIEMSEVSAAEHTRADVAMRSCS